MSWRVVLAVIAAVALLGYLLVSNFCFSQMAYVPHKQLCDVAYEQIRSEWKSDADRCHVISKTLTGYSVQWWLPRAPNQGDDHVYFFGRCGVYLGKV